MDGILHLLKNNMTAIDWASEAMTPIQGSIGLSRDIRVDRWIYSPFLSLSLLLSHTLSSSTFGATGFGSKMGKRSGWVGKGGRGMMNGRSESDRMAHINMKMPAKRCMHEAVDDDPGETGRELGPPVRRTRALSPSHGQVVTRCRRVWAHLGIIMWPWGGSAPLSTGSLFLASLTAKILFFPSNWSPKDQMKESLGSERAVKHRNCSINLFLCNSTATITTIPLFAAGNVASLR